MRAFFHFADLVQLEEHIVANDEVAGSSPAVRTTFRSTTAGTQQMECLFVGLQSH